MAHFRFQLKKPFHIQTIFILLLVFCFVATLLGNGRAWAFDPAKTFEQNCSSCHAIGSQKVGPDLKGVTERRVEEWLIKFIQSPQAVIDSGDATAKSLFDQFKIVMPNQSLSDEEVKVLLKYIKDTGDGSAAATNVVSVVPVEHGLEPSTGYYYFIVLAILVFVLLVVGLVLDRCYDCGADAFLFKPKMLFGIAVAIIIVVVGVAYVVQQARDLGYSQNYQPIQPINYSHKIHAGINKIDCKYCHYAAEKGRHAGIPPASLCLNCHNVVKTDSPEIKKIYKALESGKPIEWVKIHNLPDFVYFNHAQHVVAGKVDCQTCHGQVEKMDKVFQFAPLSMGWCIDCHRTEKVKVPGPFQGKTVAESGGLDCNKCHY